MTVILTGKAGKFGNGDIDEIATGCEGGKGGIERGMTIVMDEELLRV